MATSNEVEIFVEDTTRNNKNVTKFKPQNLNANEGYPITVLGIGNVVEGMYGPYLEAQIRDEKTGQTHDVWVLGNLRAPGFANDKSKRLIDLILSDEFKEHVGQQVSIVKFEKQTKKGQKFAVYWIGPSGGNKKYAVTAGATEEDFT